MFSPHSKLPLHVLGRATCCSRVLLTRVALTFTVVCGLSGCGAELPELGKVTGTVSMGGKPLNGVEVVFSPDPSAGDAPKASRGISDETGKYTLTYHSVDGRRVEGVAVGEHFVTIFDYLCIESRDEPIPYRFSVDLSSNSKTPFKEKVDTGEQQIDFDLTKYPNR